MSDHIELFMCLVHTCSNGNVELGIEALRLIARHNNIANCMILNMIGFTRISLTSKTMHWLNNSLNFMFESQCYMPVVILFIIVQSSSSSSLYKDQDEFDFLKYPIASPFYIIELNLLLLLLEFEP